MVLVHFLKLLKEVDFEMEGKNEVILLKLNSQVIIQHPNVFESLFILQHATLTLISNQDYLLIYLHINDTNIVNQLYYNVYVIKDICVIINLYNNLFSLNLF